MYNLLILDDEFLIVNGLTYDIEWSDIGVTDIFKAYNVHTALEHLNKHRIDVAIVDIKMPDIDGLNFAKQLFEKWPYIKVILLSGYYEFEYAQAAIDLGVFSYMSKPVRNEEVKKTVKRALESLEIDLEKVRTLENVQNLLKEVIPILQERNLNAWVVQGRLSPDRSLETLKQSNIHIGCSDSAFLILIRIGLLSDNLAKSSDIISEISLHTAIKKVLFKGNEPFLLFGDTEGNQIVLVYHRDASELERICKYVSAMAETFQLTVEKSHQQPVSVILGNIVNARDLHDDYLMTLKSLRNHSGWNAGIITGSDKQDSGGNGEKLIKLHSYPPFSHFIEYRQNHGALKWIDEVFKEAATISGVSFSTLLKIFYTIFNALTNDSLKSNTVSGDWEGKMQTFLYSLAGVSDINEMHSFCREITNAYLEYIQAIEMNKTARLVKQIMEIVEEHLHEDINVTKIASYMHLHPNYLSRLFKSEKGITIIDYLITARISKAKALLRSPDSKVYEIAASVGYESVPHFSRIFKRETGMSPKEFQQYSANE